MRTSGFPPRLSKRCGKVKLLNSPSQLSYVANYATDGLCSLLLAFGIYSDVVAGFLENHNADIRYFLSVILLFFSFLLDSGEHLSGSQSQSQGISLSQGTASQGGLQARNINRTVSRVPPRYGATRLVKRPNTSATRPFQPYPG